MGAAKHTKLNQMSPGTSTISPKQNAMFVYHSKWILLQKWLGYRQLIDFCLRRFGLEPSHFSGFPSSGQTPTCENVVSLTENTSLKSDDLSSFSWIALWHIRKLFQQYPIIPVWSQLLDQYPIKISLKSLQDSKNLSFLSYQYISSQICRPSQLFDISHLYRHPGLNSCCCPPLNMGMTGWMVCFAQYQVISIKNYVCQYQHLLPISI